MTEWFHQYSLKQCPACLAKEGCTSVQHELAYLRLREAELRRREYLDVVRSVPVDYSPLNLALKEALIRG
jgi:spermidine synthase